MYPTRIMRNQVIKVGKSEIRLLSFSVCSSILFQLPTSALRNQEDGDRGLILSQRPVLSSEGRTKSPSS